MRLVRTSLLVALFATAPAVGILVPSDAQASVSIAVAFDALVKDADSVGIVTPVESKSVWEDGRIYTYTRVKVDQGVAGELGTGGEGWVRTMGGVVGKIGQMVDGEPVFTPTKSSMIFMRKFKQGGTWEVSARAQGQYPVIATETADKKTIKKIVRSAAVGVLFPPKDVPVVGPPVAAPPAAGAGVLAPKTAVTDGDTTTTQGPSRLRLANEVLHDRALDDVTREIATQWKKLHPVAVPNDAKK